MKLPWRGVMRIDSLIFVLTMVALLPVVSVSQSKAADCLLPDKPIISADWRGEFPELTLTAGSKTNGAVKAFWARSYYSRATNKWNAFTNWQALENFSGRSRIPAPDYASNFDAVTYATYLSNQCGNSATVQFDFPLLPKSKFVLKSVTIAKEIPLQVGKLSLSDVIEESWTFEKFIRTTNDAVCRYDATYEAIKLLTTGKCDVEISIASPVLQIDIPNAQLSFTIVPTPKALERTTQDRIDDEKRFQIHLVYVVPAGQPDEFLDKNGQIGLWSNLANSWLKAGINKELVFDTYQGDLDVSFLNSRYSVSELPYDDSYTSQGKSFGTLEKLYAEFKGQSAVVPGKSYFFIVQGELSRKFCGWAAYGSQLGLMTISERCWKNPQDDIGINTGISSGSETLIHEILHNFGVEHVCGSRSDIMYSSNECDSEGESPTTIDEKKNLYVGSAVAGVNILDLKVWRDGLGTSYHLKDFCFVGQTCELPKRYWTGSTQILDLQLKQGNKWVSIATFRAVKDSTIKKYPFTYRVEHMHTSPGTYTYRYVLKANKKFRQYVSENFLISVPY